MSDTLWVPWFCSGLGVMSELGPGLTTESAGAFGLSCYRAAGRVPVLAPASGAGLICLACARGRGSQIRRQRVRAIPQLGKGRSGKGGAFLRPPSPQIPYVHVSAHTAQASPVGRFGFMPRSCLPPWFVSGDMTCASGPAWFRCFPSAGLFPSRWVRGGCPGG